MSKNQNNYTAQKKVSILREHFLENVPVSDLCDKYGFHPTGFYRWQKQFFEKGASVFEQKNTRKERRLEQNILALEKKVQTKNEVLSELMEEHVALKKKFGEI